MTVRSGAAASRLTAAAAKDIPSGFTAPQTGQSTRQSCGRKRSAVSRALPSGRPTYFSPHRLWIFRTLMIRYGCSSSTICWVTAALRCPIWTISPAGRDGAATSTPSRITTIWTTAERPTCWPGPRETARPSTWTATGKMSCAPPPAFPGRSSSCGTAGITKLTSRLFCRMPGRK